MCAVGRSRLPLPHAEAKVQYRLRLHNFGRLQERENTPCLSEEEERKGERESSRVRDTRHGCSSRRLAARRPVRWCYGSFRKETTATGRREWVVLAYGWAEKGTVVRVSLEGEHHDLEVPDVLRRLSHHETGADMTICRFFQVENREGCPRPWYYSRTFLLQERRAAGRVPESYRASVKRPLKESFYRRHPCGRMELVSDSRHRVLVAGHVSPGARIYGQNWNQGRCRGVLTSVTATGCHEGRPWTKGVAEVEAWAWDRVAKFVTVPFQPGRRRE